MPRNGYSISLALYSNNTHLPVQKLHVSLQIPSLKRWVTAYRCDPYCGIGTRVLNTIVGESRIYNASKGLGVLSLIMRFAGRPGLID